jgi:hypothetical protein
MEARPNSLRLSQQNYDSFGEKDPLRLKEEKRKNKYMSNMNKNGKKKEFRFTNSMDENNLLLRLPKKTKENDQDKNVEEEEDINASTL